MPDLLDELNPQQLEAVTYMDGPALVIAGAGSGKTRVIAHRIAYLLQERHLSPRSLLSVTFTNKAAEEMKKRVLLLMKKEALPFLWAGTFHSICARILRADCEELGGPYNGDFTILDADDTTGMIRRILRDKGISEKNFQPRAVRSAISKVKVDGVTAAKYAEAAHSHFAKTIAPVYSAYESHLAANNVMDFDDLLVLAVKLLEKSETVRKAYQSRFLHIMVDEYQDTNRIQYKLLRLLAGDNGTLFAVGDEDQSIYRWRGADIHNILDFQRDFRDARVIRLERNYRSTTPILSAANELIKNNTQRLGKNLWTEKPGGALLKLYAAISDREEAAYVADRVKDLHATVSWSNMAVLYRTNAQSRNFEESLLNKRIPYQVIGGLRFYERKEVRDVIAYLRMALNPMDGAALMRVINIPARGIGKVTIEKIEKTATGGSLSRLEAIRKLVEGGDVSSRTASSLKGFLRIVDGSRQRLEKMSPSDLTEWILEETGYFSYLAGLSRQGPDPEARMENVRELVSAMKSYESLEGNGLRGFLERQALYSDQDELDRGTMDSVKLMTLHAAKGLEFDVVFLAGLEQELFPHVLSSGSEEELEEERRLCYVGMTRAKELLHLTWARRRFVYGIPQNRLPSRFLKEIPSALVEEVSGVGKAPTGLFEAAAMLTESRKRSEVPAFRIGGRVHHSKYGFGIILGTSGSGENLKVTVSFNRYGRKKMLARLAKLDRV